MNESAEFFLKPNGKGIDTVRKKSDRFLKSHGMSESTVHEQIMIIDELVKFGSTFGKFALLDKQIRVRINIDENAIRIEVSKPIDEAGLNHLKELDKTIQFIRGFQDPFEAFLKMKAASGSPHNKASNGLGLAKIAYEGKAIVDFFVNEDNILNLSAVRSLRDEYQN